MTKAKEETKSQLFSFKIEMVAHLFANDEKTAREQLDAQGGFVDSKDRKVTLIASQDLPVQESYIRVVQDE